MKSKITVNGHAVMKKVLVLLCSVIMISFTGVTLHAEAAEDTANLTVTWSMEGIDLVLYKVADRNSEGGYDLTDDFKDYDVEILGIEGEELENAA